MSLDNVRTGFATNWFRTNVDVMQPKEIGFVHPPRKWQSECFETIAPNNPISIINAPTGSGKSTMLSMLAYQRTVSDNKKKTIIAVPQTVIGKGFNTKVFKLPDGQVIDWSVGVDLCTNAKDTVEQFTNFISEDIFYSEAYPFERILVCTHATLVAAFQSLSPEDKQNHWNNLLICVDETHHIQMHEIADEVYNMNSLGQVVDYSFRNNNEIILVSATMFRGDQKGLVSDELLKDATKYNLPFDKYMEEMKHLKSFSYDFIIDTNEYTEDISKCINNLFTENLKKLFIYIPHPKSYMSSGNKIKEIQDILEQLKNNLNGDKITLDENTGIYHITNILGLDYKVCDLVDESLSKRSIKFVNNEIINKDRNALDCVIALNRAKEGFDWEHANGMIVVGQRNSLTDVIQMVGRLLRDKQGKEKVKALHMLPFSPNQPTAPNLDNSLNDFFKAIAISLLMEDVFAPTPLQTNDDSAPTGQLSGATPSVSSNIFDDLELDENQRLDLFDKAQKALVNVAGGLVESQGTYSPEELKEQMPSIMKKWVEENKIEADEQQIEELAKKIYNQFAKRSLQMQGINVSNINWQMIESADPIEFTLRYVGKDTTLESLKELRRLINAGESESNVMCHKVCQWIVENNGQIPAHSSDDKDVSFMGKWIHHQKENKSGVSLGNWYQSNQMIAENLYGLPKLFDKIDYEDMQLINIEEVYQWYLKNNKIPSPYSKEIEEKRLGKRRSEIIFSLNNEYGIKIYEKSKLLIVDEKYNFLFLQTDLLDNQEKRCHKVCKKIIENNGKIPTSRSKNDNDKKDATWIGTMKRCKKIELSGEIDNDGNRWYPSLQIIAEKYGLHNLFEYVDLEQNSLINAEKYVNFLIDNNNNEPKIDSLNDDEKKVAIWKTTYCKALRGKVGTVYNSVNIFLESKNVFENFLSHEQKQMKKCLDLCDFANQKQRLPKSRGQETNEKQLYSWMNAQIKPGKTKQEYIDVITTKNVQHFFEGLI
jgi:superfamily II DNA or RNA helicase